MLTALVDESLNIVIAKFGSVFIALCLTAQLNGVPVGLGVNVGVPVLVGVPVFVGVCVIVGELVLDGV